MDLPMTVDAQAAGLLVSNCAAAFHPELMQSFYLAMGGLTLTALIAMADGDTISAEADVPTTAQSAAPVNTLADPDIIFSENPEQAAAEKAVYDELVFDEKSSAPLDDPFGNEPQPMPTNRSKYLELLRRKAELMTDEQIDAELQEVTVDIGELEASRKLEHVMTELQALVCEHPDSVAGQKARRMVETASMPTVSFDEQLGGFRRVDEPDSKYSSKSPASRDDRGDGHLSPRPLEAQPTPADSKALPPI
jgi:hypothetical protein